MTYDHRPEIVYQQYPAGGVHYLTPLPRKLDLLKQLGVDRVYLVNLTSALSALDPQTFVDQYLVGFHTQVAVAGYDHTYGADPSVANMAHLKEFAKGRFEVVTVEKLTLQDNHKVGSTRIRELLELGDVQSANELLGYFYQTPAWSCMGLRGAEHWAFPRLTLPGLKQSGCRQSAFTSSR